ncbi:hypothetical protein TNCV_1203161 [Trichonephila clavipes]|nr:hypothetical protein TNCV_1203161 [Trichonephila clavipes]
MLPKELHQLKYEAISVSQGQFVLSKRHKKEKDPLAICDHQRRHEFDPSTTKDPSSIEISRRPKLTGIVRGKAFLRVLRRRPIGCPDSRKRTR